jgi:hypothetical protein
MRKGKKMKKAVLVLLLVLTVSFCFARGQRHSLEFGVGYYHLLNTSHTLTHLTMPPYTELDVETTTSIPSIALNISTVNFFTEKIGIGLYTTILIPLKITTTVKSQSTGYEPYEDTQSTTKDGTDFDLFFGMDFLLGPTIMLYENDKFSLPLTVGFHFSGITAKKSSSGLSFTNLDFGGNLTGEYHISNKLYAYARFQFSTLFLISGNASENLSRFGLYPSIGVVWNFGG